MIEGYVDVSSVELHKYARAVAAKRGTCRILPAGRFYLTTRGLVFDGLVCRPQEMGGEATGVAAESCRNCVLPESPPKPRARVRKVKR